MMSNKGELIVLIGLPASGKTTWAKRYMQENKENTVWLSSDDIRKELSGDEATQLLPNCETVGESHAKVFELLHSRVKENLQKGINVIYDATNTSAKRRTSLLKEMAKHHLAATAVYFNTSVGKCIFRDSIRDRSVGEEVIRKMYKGLQVPTYSEGWDLIKFVKFVDPIRVDWRYTVDATLSRFEVIEHDKFFDWLLTLAPEFKPCINLPQDSKHHAFSVSRHIYHAMSYTYEHYEQVFGMSEGKTEMMLAALFHDVGKGYTKEFNGRYANFIGHENVSAQIAALVLQRWGYDIDTILRVVELVQYHMRLMQYKDVKEKVVEKFKNFVGEQTFQKLMFLHEADTSAK